MKRLITFLCVILFMYIGLSAQNICLTIDYRSWKNEYGNEQFRKEVQNNISKLLSAINNADYANRSVNYEGINITEIAKQSLNRVWTKQCRFKVIRPEINACVYKSGAYYQIRDINVSLTDKSYKGTRDRDVVITFNKSGEIEGINLQPTDFNINAIIYKGRSVNDLEQRLQILHYVERFRSFYETKDIDNINNIFSDNALIITGTVTKVAQRKVRDNPNVKFENTIEYNVRKKTEYIRNLRMLFQLTQSIDLTFTGIKVMRHPAKQNIYMQYRSGKCGSLRKKMARHIWMMEIYICYGTSQIQINPSLRLENGLM